MTLWQRVKSFFGFSPGATGGEAPKAAPPRVEQPLGLAPQPRQPPPLAVGYTSDGRPVVVLAPAPAPAPAPDDEDDSGWAWVDDVEPEQDIPREPPAPPPAQAPERQIEPIDALEPPRHAMELKGGLLAGEEGSLLFTLDSWLDKYDRSTLPSIGFVPDLDVTLPDGQKISFTAAEIQPLLGDSADLYAYVAEQIRAFYADKGTKAPNFDSGCSASSAGGESEEASDEELGYSGPDEIEQFQFDYYQP